MLNNSQYFDLDLDALDATQDPDKLPVILGSLIQADSDYKVIAARQWTENFLYYCGTRNTGSRFASGTVTGNSLNLNSTAANNGKSSRKIHKLFKAVQVMAANMTRQRPSIKVWAEYDDERSEAKAKLSNILLDYYWEPDCEDDLNYECMLWALLTPTVARKDFKSYEFNKSRLWPIMEDGIDPQTGQPAEQMKQDQDGNTILQQLPWNKTELVSAYRLIFNPTATWTTSLDYVGDVSVKRLGWIRQNYYKMEEGYFPENVAKVKSGSWNFTTVMAMEAAMKQLTFGMFNSARSWNSTTMMMKDGVVHGDFYIKPSPYYPEGRQIVVANGFTLYDGKPLVYRENPTVSFHPYSFLCYERVPGRLWGTTYAEKLIDLQKAYESARSSYDQMQRTMSKPKIAIPVGAQIDRDTVTGNEEIWRYNPFGPGGGKPEFMSSPQPSTVLTDDIKMMQMEFTESSGMTELQQGINPKGVTTYRGLEVLKEEANNSQSNCIRQYESFITKSQYNKLENIRSCLKYPDKNLTNAVKIFKKMKQYITDIDIEDFSGDGLGGFVVIEPMSSIGKSQLALQEKYASLAQMGILGDVVHDPDLNTEFKKKQGIMGFEMPQNKQVIFARYENQLMLQAEDKQMIINPPVADFHDDPIHIREVENLLLDPALLSKPAIVQSLMAHRTSHQQAAAQKMAASMQSAMQQQMGGTMPPPGAPPPPTPSGPPQPGAMPHPSGHMGPKGNGSGPMTQASHGGGETGGQIFGPESGGTQNAHE